MALTDPMALRSMQGICTKPAEPGRRSSLDWFHADFGRIFDLFVAAVERRYQTGRRHGARDPDLALTAHLGA